MRAFLSKIIPFDEPQADASALLFNAGSRKRRLRVDAMIACTALAAGAKLATSNISDFKTFRPHGLQFV